MVRFRGHERARQCGLAALAGAEQRYAAMDGEGLPNAAQRAETFDKHGTIFPENHGFHNLIFRDK